MRILVTGAAGFLGSWLVEALFNAGHSVVGYDNLVGGDWDNIPAEVMENERYTQYTAGIENLEALVFAARGCDAVYHCAALAYEGLSVFSPGLVVGNIISGSVNVMSAAIQAGVKRFINLSSMARYGNCLAPYYEDQLPQPVDPYGLAKYQAEQQLNLLGKIHRVEVVHAIPHNIYGPRQCYTDPYRNVAAIMVSRLLQGKPPIIYGDGEQQRSFSYVSDVVPTLLQLLHEGEHGEVFNVGPSSKTAVSINSLSSLLRELTGRIDLEPVYVAGRPCEVKVAVCANAKIHHRFGFFDKVGLRGGMTELVEWLRKKGPQPFDYHLPIELNNSPQIPRTWKDRLI